MGPRAKFRQIAQLLEIFLAHTDLQLVGGSLRADVRHVHAEDVPAADVLALFATRFTRVSTPTL